MGRRFSPALRSGVSAPAGRFEFGWTCVTRANPMWRRVLWLALLVMAVATSGTVGARAETLTDQLARKTTTPAGHPQEHLVVSAKELDYDTNHNTVSAVGDVQLYYQGRVLQADRVVYDRKTDRVYAEGHAKITDTDGSVGYADRFDLTDDLKNGFIDSLRVDTVDHTHITAARAERTDGETTVFDKGTYTACGVCANNNAKPPLWQVRAERIIHKNDEQMIYFEDADLELLGVPIAWLPYFSAPDPSVKRKTGFLTPTYITKSRIGFGVGTPFFWNIAPDKDLTVTPMVLTRQGFLGQAEWRQQFANGSYSIKATGINQLDPSAFSDPPYGAGTRTQRGAVQSTGLFYLNQDWKFGWDGSLETDKYFLQDYTQPNQSLSANYFKDLISSIYLTGQSDRGYLDIRGYYITDQSEASLQQQQPIVAPTINYNKSFNLPPQATLGIGGEVTLDANFTSLSRTLASYQTTGPRMLDNAYGLYNVCETPTNAPAYTRGNCLLNGVGGTYSRATVNLSWQRQYIDPIGEIWTPFAFARVNGELLDLNTGTSATFTSPNGTSTISNATETNFVGGNPNQVTGVVTPGAGIEYRYPFIASNSWGTQVLEPIAQIIVRPNVPVSQAQVNEDAQSLVFDDSTLFEWNKYSGDDRFEGGTRANYGAQYTMTFNNGGYFNLMGGQSYLIAGTNSYATPDAANVGLSSGLDTRASDYVSRVAVALDPRFSFIAKGRFSSTDFSMERLDLMANANFGALQASVQFARYNAQPLLGYDKRREGLALNSKYQLNPNYFLSSNVIFDLTRHLYNEDLGGHAPLFAVAGLGLGAGYSDDCIGLNLNYTSVYQDNGFGVLTRNQTVMVELQLRTLGDSKATSSFADLKNQDGLTNLE